VVHTGAVFLPNDKSTHTVQRKKEREGIEVKTNHKVTNLDSAIVICDNHSYLGLKRKNLKEKKTNCTKKQKKQGERWMMMQSVI